MKLHETVPEIPKEIAEAKRPKQVAFDELTARIDDVIRKEGRGMTLVERAEIMIVLEAAAKDELWRLRALAEESGRVPEKDFETLRFMVKERRFASQADEDAGIFLHERDEVQAEAHQTLAQFLELIGDIEKAEAEMAGKKGEDVPQSVQSARRRWVKREMDYWHYAGAA